MIKPLTSLRFLFSVLIFLSHSAYAMRSHPELYWPFKKIFTEGEAGVSFFFVLSGFILTKSYKDHILTNILSLKEFWLRRLVRIYPLHIITLFLLVGYSIYGLRVNGTLLDVEQFLLQFSLNIFLLQSFYPKQDVYFAFNAPAWSISCTLFFYLLFPSLVKLSQFIKTYALIIIIASIILSIGMLFTNNNKIQHFVFYVNPFVRILDFAIGVLLYCLLENSKYDKLKDWYTPLEVGSLILLTLFIGAHDYIIDVYKYSIYYWIPVIAIIGTFYFQGGVISKLLSKKWAVYLGNLSFSFYLIHWGAIRFFSGINHKLGITDNGLILLILIFVITLFSSAASFSFIERPLIKKANYLISHVKLKLKK